MKLTFSHPVATAEFSKFAGILSAALSRHHLLGFENGSIGIPIPKKGNDKECSSYWTIALISHTSKVILKILQARLQKVGEEHFKEVGFWYIPLRYA